MATLLDICGANVWWRNSLLGNPTFQVVALALASAGLIYYVGLGIGLWGSITTAGVSGTGLTGLNMTLSIVTQILMGIWVATKDIGRYIFDFFRSVMDWVTMASPVFFKILIFFVTFWFFGGLVYNNTFGLTKACDPNTGEVKTTDVWSALTYQLSSGVFGTSVVEAEAKIIESQPNELKKSLFGNSGACFTKVKGNGVSYYVGIDDQGNEVGSPTIIQGDVYFYYGADCTKCTAVNLYICGTEESNCVSPTEFEVTLQPSTLSPFCKPQCSMRKACASDAYRIPDEEKKKLADAGKLDVDACVCLQSGVCEPPEGSTYWRQSDNKYICEQGQLCSETGQTKLNSAIERFSAAYNEKYISDSKVVSFVCEKNSDPKSKFPYNVNESFRLVGIPIFDIKFIGFVVFATILIGVIGFFNKR
jgi:hypothetical protein